MLGMGWGGSEVNCVIVKRGGVGHFRGMIPLSVSQLRLIPPLVLLKIK